MTRQDTPRRPVARTPLTALVLGFAALLLGTATLAGGCRKEVPPPPPPPPAILIPPLHDAVVGEELRLRRGTEDWVWRVASATDNELGIDFFVYRDGAPTGPPEALRWPRNGFGMPPDFVIREISRDRVVVADRSWDCWRVRAFARDGARWYWITDELPVHGVIRMALDDRGRPVLQSAADVVPEASARPR